MNHNEMYRIDEQTVVKKVISDRKDTAWDTTHEINFLKKLGTFSRCNKAPVPRLSLLFGYLQASCSRNNWGDIDSVAVVNYAINCLNDELFAIAKKVKSAQSG